MSDGIYMEISNKASHSSDQLYVAKFTKILSSKVVNKVITQHFQHPTNKYSVLLTGNPQ